MSRLFMLVALSLSTGCGALIKTKPVQNASLSYYTGEGGVIVSMGSSDDPNAPGLSNVCLFPPAQAVRVISPEGEGKVEVPDVIDVSGSGKANHSNTTLYSQTTSTLFLQMAMYRLCEAEGNGYLNDGDYTTLFKDILATSKELAKSEVEASDKSARIAEAQAKVVEEESAVRRDEIQLARERNNAARGP